MEVMAVKAIDNSLRPVTQIDVHELAPLKVGQAVKVRITRQKERSLQHHRLFFGGLLPLAFDYWQPTGGLVSQSEKAVVIWVAKQLDRLAGGKGIIVSAAEEALKVLAKKRGQKITVIQKNMDSFRKWLTIEAGFYELHETPSGVIKVPRSISFKEMEQDEFNKFYRACFDVCWNMLLCHQFCCEEEAQNAINQMMSLGG